MTTYTSQEAKTTADWLRADASFDKNEPSTRKGKLRTADLCEQLAALLRAREEAKPVAIAQYDGSLIIRRAVEPGTQLFDHLPHWQVEPRFWLKKTDAAFIGGKLSGQCQVIAHAVPPSKTYVPFYDHPPTDSAEAKWKDPTGFSSQSIRDEANNWTQRHTGKEMLLNYAACLEAMCAESREGDES